MPENLPTESWSDPSSKPPGYDGDITNQTSLDVTVTYRYVRAATIACITLAIYLLNPLSFYLLYKTRSSQHWQNTVIVLCIFTEDLLNGMTTYTISTIGAFDNTLLTAPYLARAHLFFWLFWGIFNMWTLAWASIVQYLAVVRPLHFEQEVTPKRVMMGVLAAFTLGASWATYGVSTIEFVVISPVSLLPYFGETSDDINAGAFTSFATAGLIIVCCYARIFLMVVKQKRQIASMEGNHDDHGNHGDVVAAIKSAKKIFVLVFMYFLVHVPLGVFTAVPLSPEFGAGLVVFFGVWLYSCYSFCNSLVYILMHGTTRRALRDMVTTSGASSAENGQTSNA